MYLQISDIYPKNVFFILTIEWKETDRNNKIVFNVKIRSPSTSVTWKLNKKACTSYKEGMSESHLTVTSKSWSSSEVLSQALVALPIFLKEIGKLFTLCRFEMLCFQRQVLDQVKNNSFEKKLNG